MSLFKKQPVSCPLCGEEVVDDKWRSIGHFGKHLVDVGDVADGRLGLQCGCSDAHWSVDEDWQAAARKHLRYRHGVRLQV